MTRPEKTRRICCEPPVCIFKPSGAGTRNFGEVKLGMDEFEALRVADFACLGQGEISSKMGISQPTLSRVLSSARKKVAAALCEGKAAVFRRIS